jgi:hypothetical protein
MKWYLHGTEETLRDYHADLKDVNGHGGYLRLTIDTDAKAAWMCVHLDNDSGDVATEAELKVPMPWALAVAQGVDGFTLTEEATHD